MAAESFILHPQLEQDCATVGRFRLCRLLMMNDSLYPWFILVPERPGISEIYQLAVADQRLLMDESSRLSVILADLYCADKMNIAAIGNLVPQLHVHHVVRYRSDKAWPAPVWGKLPRQPYRALDMEAALRGIREKLIGDMAFEAL